MLGTIGALTDEQRASLLAAAWASELTAVEQTALASATPDTLRAAASARASELRQRLAAPAGAPATLI